MSDKTVPEIIDVVFDLQGSQVHADYAFSLWEEVVRYLPWLAEIEYAGIVPLRGSASGEDTLLSRRTKLILRLPASLAKQALELSGKQLNVDGSTLVVGGAREKPLQVATTLHAYMVESDLGEVEFLDAMNEKLQKMSIPCKLICSKQISVKNAKHALNGYGLVLHDLKPAASVRIQSEGLGGARHFGCGMFVHYKAITGLD